MIGCGVHAGRGDWKRSAAVSGLGSFKLVPLKELWKAGLEISAGILPTKLVKGFFFLALCPP